MKSGIRSIGLNAYATTHAATTFAYHGVRGSRTARYSAYVSRLIRRAHCRARACQPDGAAGAAGVVPDVFSMLPVLPASAVRVVLRNPAPLCHALASAASSG